MFSWNETLYSYTKIYDSLSPIARICVDLRIQGRKPAYIAKAIKRPKSTIIKALYRTKKRYLEAFQSQSMPIYEKMDISNREGTDYYELL